MSRSVRAASRSPGRMFSLLQVLQMCSRGDQLIAPAPPSSMLKMMALKSAIAMI